MLRRAQSFESRTGSPERAVAAFHGAFKEVSAAAAGIMFISGSLLEQQEALARLLAERQFGIPLLLVGAAGVLSERGELEGQSAATGLVWAGANAEIGVIDANRGDEGLCEGLGRFVAEVGNRAAVVLFVSPGGFTPRAIQLLGQSSLGNLVFGGGTVGQPGVIAVGAQGELVTGRAVAMAVRGLGVPRVRTTYSCRLLGPLRPITKARGSLVLELGGEPALDVLTRAGQNLQGQPLIFTVLARNPQDRELADEPRQLLIRGVQGIDPQARGLVVSEEVREGLFMTFGIRDPAAARDDLERLARELGREIAGAAPLAALYVNCGGRGRGLYGRANVDTRILRERFGDIPIAGMQSAFEIGPFGDAPSFQLYTGVLGLFSALS